MKTVVHRAGRDCCAADVAGDVQITPDLVIPMATAVMAVAVEEGRTAAVRTIHCAACGAERERDRERVRQSE